MALGNSGVIPGGNAPGISATVVTKSDTVNIVPGPSRWLWIGSAGTLTVLMENDTVPVQFLAVPVGRLDLRVKRVYASGSSAASIVAVF